MIRRVLIVDDEIDIQSSLSFALKDEGYEVESVSSPKAALELLEHKAFHVALFDVWFPEGDGVELLKESLELYPSMSVIMMSGHGNIELALKSIRMGAYDFLEKPLELEKVLVLLRNACETSVLKFENQSLIGQIFGNIEVIAKSAAMKELESQVVKVAPTKSHVLLLGESGSGRGLLARVVHSKSQSSQKPFVTLHCASLDEDTWEEEMFGQGDTPGRLELASGGTLFLNGVSELPLAAQAKLFRVLEEKSFERKGRTQKLPLDLRIVASSSKDLSDLVEAQKFREDLYFLLKVVVLKVPALRERREDIEDLSAFFMSAVQQEHGHPQPRLGSDLLNWMRAYEWPGNVRELKNFLERSLIMAGEEQKTLEVSDLPEDLMLESVDVESQPTELDSFFASHKLQGDLRALRSKFEYLMIRQRLEQESNNVTRAAESLGIERAHLHRKMKQLGLSS